MDTGIVKQFEDHQIRSAWSAEEERWYFSIVDVVGALTDQSSTRGASTYWAVLKKRLVNEGANQLLTNCKQLKMPAKDGRMRRTDVADTEQLLRIIQSIPSKRAEPFKQWLAQVGAERIQEAIDPELAMQRAMEPTFGHLLELSQEPESTSSPPAMAASASSGSGTFSSLASASSFSMLPHARAFS